MLNVTPPIPGLASLVHAEPQFQHCALLSLQPGANRLTRNSHAVELVWNCEGAGHSQYNPLRTSCLATGPFYAEPCLRWMTLSQLSFRDDIDFLVANHIGHEFWSSTGRRAGINQATSYRISPAKCRLTYKRKMVTEQPPQDPNEPYQPYQGQPQPPYGRPNHGQPQQPYQGGAPNWAPPPPTPKKRKKWPFIVGGIIVLIVIIALASGGGEDEKKSDTATTSAAAPAAGGTEGAPQAAPAPAEDEDQAPGLNAPARDGKFEFVVTGFEGGLTSIGDNPYLTEQASGQFVVVDLTVKNIGEKGQSFTPTTQKLLDSQGREFEVNTSAMIAADSSDIPVFDNINPGNTVNIKLVFDMPADATAASLELHDSMFSGGVKVNLS